MIQLADLLLGHGIWVDHHGTHPAVVLEPGAERCTIICGTRTQRPILPVVRVRPNSPAARALELNAVTYFYRSGIAILDDAKKIRSVSRRCPPNVLHDLEALLRA